MFMFVKLLISKNVYAPKTVFIYYPNILDQLWLSSVLYRLAGVVGKLYTEVYDSFEGVLVFSFLYLFSDSVVNMSLLKPRSVLSCLINFISYKNRSTIQLHICCIGWFKFWRAQLSITICFDTKNVCHQMFLSPFVVRHQMSLSPNICH